MSSSSRKVVLGMHISLDGFLAASGGGLSWCKDHFDAEMERWILSSLSQSSTIVLGRVAYQEMSRYWPRSLDTLAAPMNALEKVVFTDTLHNVDAWENTRIAHDEIAEEILRLKRLPGKDILVQGGASTAQAIVSAGLIDEYRLITHPVMLGGGVSLFKSVNGGAGRLNLKLVSSSVFGSGARADVYASMSAAAARVSSNPAPSGTTGMSRDESDKNRYMGPRSIRSMRATQEAEFALF